LSLMDEEPSAAVTGGQLLRRLAAQPFDPSAVALRTGDKFLVDHPTSLHAGVRWVLIPGDVHSRRSRWGDLFVDYADLAGIEAAPRAAGAA